LCDSTDNVCSTDNTHQRAILRDRDTLNFAFGKERYQKIMATGQSYLKPWTDFLEQYQKMMGSFSRSFIARWANERERP